MSNQRIRFLETAHQLGAVLCRDAIWWQQRCNWLGSAMESLNGTWTVIERAHGPDLYGGTAGIALFLAHLFRATSEKPFRSTALGALNQAWSKLDEFPPVARHGFYSGWIGVAYARLIIAESVGEAEHGRPALKLIESLARSDQKLEALDVISGCAGAIPVLLEFYRRFPGDWLLDFAIRRGEHLLNTARRRDEGWSWKTLEMNMRDHLTGFSHGAGGIAWALLELYLATGDKRWRAAAEEGFRYERHWFDPRVDNWADLRIFDQPTAVGAPAFSMAWCHGAPGICLSRLRAWDILREDIYKQEAEAALRATATSLVPSGPSDSVSFSLCHGRAGNAEGHLYASQILDLKHASVVEAVADYGIRSCHATREPWPCGIKGGGETPNLMLGLAGIGYFYLRLFDPDAMHSILIVHPKPSTTGEAKGREPG